MDYSDIINLPHPVSKRHPQMSLYMRAAQFAPFAALNGHNAAIQETARVTDSERDLSDEERCIMDRQLQSLLQHIDQSSPVTITHFVADKRKAGGAYHSTRGNIRKWDEYNHILYLDTGEEIPLHTILHMEIDN